MLVSHRDITIYACIVVVALSILLYADKIDQTMYLSFITAISGYVVRDREGYIRRYYEERTREKENGK